MDFSHQGLGQNDIPQGDLNCSVDVGIEDVWESLEELEQTINMPECSGITAAPGISSFSPKVHGTTFVAFACERKEILLPQSKNIIISSWFVLQFD